MLFMPGNDEYWDAATQLNFYESATADHSTIISAGGSGGGVVSMLRCVYQLLRYVNGWSRHHNHHCWD